MAQGRIVGEMSLPSGSVNDDTIGSNADVAVSKLRHLHKSGSGFALAIGGTPTTREEILHVALGAGTVRSFHALLNETGSSTEIDFDLKKNGISILSAEITITDANTDRETVDGTLSNGTFVAGDVLSVAMTVTSATGAQGPFAWAEIDEAAG